LYLRQFDPSWQQESASHSLRLQLEGRTGATAPQLCRTNWAFAADIMCVVLSNSAAGIITLGVCYLARSVLFDMHCVSTQHVNTLCSYTVCYLTYCVPTQRVTGHKLCSYTAYYLAHCVLTQHVIWQCVPTHRVTWHTVYPYTLCSYILCYLAHSVFLHNILPDCVLTQGVTWHIVFLHSVIFGTLCYLCSYTACYLTHCVPTQHLIWHKVCSYTAWYLAHSVLPVLLRSVLPDTLCSYTASYLALVLTQHDIWDSATLFRVRSYSLWLATHPVIWHTVCSYTVCYLTVWSYTGCYLTHCVPTHQSYLAQSLLSGAQCVTLLTVCANRKCN
jgi:hypothetical protein